MNSVAPRLGRHISAFASKSPLAAVAGVAVATIAGCALPAQANLTIVPTFDTTITSDPNAATIEAGINAAISRVDSYIANNVTDNITFAEMSSGLGESSTLSYSVPYATYVNALLTQQTLSANDVTAIASLGYVPNVTTTNPVNGAGSVNVQTSLARALGIANYSGSDGTVSLNTSIMNLSRTGPQNSSDYDIQAVAGHEIDEFLGIGGPGSALPTTNGNIGVLDLYRYSAANTRSFTTSLAAPEPYFSINSGVTDLVHFDQNNQGADEADWGNGTVNGQTGNTPPQLQDSYGTPGVDVNIGTNELIALDVIGYNLNPVPEPASIAVFALGALGLIVRGKRAKST